ncbi:MAG: type II toxin-antitoxin system RelE/ParE family toxin [Burkholderiales bacterium]|nr:type II toxin-antitoxin system RelE/ParE family toxin [Phycisphaerae bacterium]
MKYILIVQPLASADIQEHYQYLFERSPQAASGWLVEIHKVIAELSEFAEWHPMAPEAGELEIPIRQLLHGRRGNKHRILYIIRKCEVHVLHVRHGKKKPLAKDDELA